MTNEQKKQVKDALVRYISKFTSQTTAAESLEGISTSTISQVKNDNWELLSERMWHNIARQVGFYCGEWQAADTSAYMLLRILFGDAQHYAMTYGISFAQGMGKTFTAARYTRENDGTFYIACNEQYNRRSFIIALLNAAGLEAKGSVPEMIQQYAAYIGSHEEPLLIFDDADKLKDRVLHLIILLSNSLSGNAGIIIMGGQILRDRIIEGVRLKKIGFDEIFKSIGRRFMTLSCPAAKDIELVCQANGIVDDDMIAHILDESKNNMHNTYELITKHTSMNMAA